MLIFVCLGIFIAMLIIATLIHLRDWISIAALVMGGLIHEPVIALVLLLLIGRGVVIAPVTHSVH